MEKLRLKWVRKNEDLNTSLSHIVDSVPNQYSIDISMQLQNSMGLLYHVFKTSVNAFLDVVIKNYLMFFNVYDDKEMDPI